MEHYVAADIELVPIDEDVIAASTANTTAAVESCYQNHNNSWVIEYSDGTTETVPANWMEGNEKPSVCP